MIDPDDLEGYIQKVVDNRWKEKEQELLKKHNIPTPGCSGENFVEEEDDEFLGQLNFNHNSRIKSINHSGERRVLNHDEKIKSPSDTTIYAPALQKTPVRQYAVIPEQQMRRSIFPKRVELQDKEINAVSKFSNFIEGVRLETTRKETTNSSRKKQVEVVPEGPKEEAAKLILESEKFNADTVLPPGEKIDNNIENRFFLGVGQPNNQVGIIDDDDFFHVTCHIDKSLALKIERGEYVDLEKLLTRDRFRRRESDRLEFVSREGHMYLTPVQDRDQKINGIRRWEQAFRVYAAIYSKANPMRAAEIWQYIHSINTAASNYIWENVSYYDFTFRQMMGQNPRRSWAKTYNQLWMMSMCTPIQNNQSKLNYNHSFGHSGGNHKSSNGNGNGSKNNSNGGGPVKRPCWKFNKNQPCDGSCGFEHVCSYCGAKSHTVLSCYKLHGKKRDSSEHSK